MISASLEASVRDFIVRWLIRYPQARLSPELRSLKVRFVEYEALAPDDRMRYLVGVLERELGAALKPGTGRFECLLSPFGLGTSLEPEHRRTLSELAAVRNVIVHRAGIADERLLELCPWLEVKVGDQVNVTRAQFIGFRKAASEYVVAIIAAAKAALAKSKADSAA